jgi:hypothetical protein
MALNSLQIVALACAEAKCPGYTVQGGRYLNLVLKDLWLHRDLKVNRKTQGITISTASTGPFALETDYQRTYDLFYQVNGLPYFLKPAAMEMFDRQFKDPSIANYPYMYATDLSTAAQATFSTAGTLYIYPQTSASLTLTHRYMQKRDDISSPESVTIIPWFEDQDYLVKATAGRLMGITDDERQEKYLKDCENMLRIHLIMAADDEQPIAHYVKLDPWRFRSSGSGKPTKLTD